MFSDRYLPIFFIVCLAGGETPPLQPNRQMRAINYDLSHSEAMRSERSEKIGQSTTDSNRKRGVSECSGKVRPRAKGTKAIV